MYNGLQMKIDRRFRGGLGVTTSYTWGRGMGFQTGDDGGPLFYINFRRNYARTDFDRTQTFVQSYIYDLPFSVRARSGSPTVWLPTSSAAGAPPACSL